MPLLINQPPVVTMVTRPKKVKTFFNAKEILALRHFGLTLGEIMFLSLIINSHYRYSDRKLTAKKNYKADTHACWFRSINRALEDWRGGDRTLQQTRDVLKANNLISFEYSTNILTSRKITKLVPCYHVIYNQILEERYKLKSQKLKKGAENNDKEMDNLVDPDVLFQDFKENLVENWLEFLKSDENNDQSYKIIYLSPSLKDKHKRKKAILYKDLKKNIVKLNKRHYVKPLNTNQLIYISRSFNLSLNEIGFVNLLIGLNMCGFCLKDNKEFLGKLLNLDSDTIRNTTLPNLTKRNIILVEDKKIVLNHQTIANLHSLSVGSQIRSTHPFCGIQILNQDVHLYNSLDNDCYSSRQFSPTTKSVDFVTYPCQFECLNHCLGYKSRHNLPQSGIYNFMFECDNAPVEEQLKVSLTLAELGIVNRIVLSGNKSVHARISVAGVHLFDKGCWSGEYEQVWDILSHLFTNLKCDNSFRSDPVRWTRCPDQTRDPIVIDTPNNQDELVRVHNRQELIFLSDACISVDLNKHAFGEKTKCNLTKLDRWQLGDFGDHRHDDLPFIVSACKARKLRFKDFEKLLMQIPENDDRDNLISYARQLYSYFCPHLM